MLNIGDVVQRTVCVTLLAGTSGFCEKKMSCPAEVVYIHPEHRFYEVMITLPNGARYRDTLYFGPKAAQK